MKCVSFVLVLLLGSYSFAVNKSAAERAAITTIVNSPTLVEKLKEDEIVTSVLIYEKELKATVHARTPDPKNFKKSVSFCTYNVDLGIDQKFGDYGVVHVSSCGAPSN